ncbi:hypothetical protein [Sulfurimonas sp. NWX79]|uniref:hypothetical protein n=1 Tax=Campylobacterales TaxID=213849 RepID=UPI0032048359|nr:transcription termination factor [Sulfurimonas phage SNW-1]
MKAIKTEIAIKCGGKHFKAEETLLVGKGKDISLKDAKYLVGADAAIEVVAPAKNEDTISIEEMLEVEDLFTLNVSQLKAICKHLGLTPYSGKKESELIEMIESHRNSDVFDIDVMDEDELRTLAEEEGISIPENADIEMIRQIIDEALGE